MGCNIHVPYLNKGRKNEKILKLGLGVAFAFVTMLSLTGCGKEANNPNNDNLPSQEQKQNDGTQNTSNTENTNKTVVTDGSKLGVLQSVVDQQDFAIKGLYINSGSGQHKYEHVDDIAAFGVNNLNSEYELNEWIAFYVDTESKKPINIYVVRNNIETDYSKITVSELENICSEKDYPVLENAVPDEEQKGYLGQIYVHPESSSPDLFNAFITANGKVYYMVQLKLIAENSTMND